MLAYSEELSGDLASDIGEVSAVGWHGPAGMEFDEWVRVGNTLQQVGNSINWWVGDWLNYGESKWGEMYAQAIEITGWEYERLRRAKWVSGAVELCLRKHNLSWSHHIEIAKLSKDEQERWLQRAESEGLSVTALRDAIRQSQPPPPAPVDDDVPFSSASPRIAPPVTTGNGNGNGNGNHSPVDEYEQVVEVWQESSSGYDWAEPTEPAEDEPPVVSRSVSPTVPLSVPLTAPPPKMAVHFSSETPEHYTPRMVIDAVIECMGGIDLDPCSNSHESPNVPAGEHFTAEDDGLRQVWRGRVYMNPPYGREIVDWVDKLVKAHESGSVTEAIALVPARTDTKWWAMLRDYPVCLVSGRLKFGEAENGAPFPSAVFYLGNEIDRFYHSFSGLGDIWQRVAPGMFGE